MAFVGTFVTAEEAFLIDNAGCLLRKAFVGTFATAEEAFLIDNAGCLLPQTDEPARGMPRQSCVDATTCDHPARDTFKMDTSQTIAEVTDEVISWVMRATCREACAGVAAEVLAAVASHRAVSRLEHQPTVVAPPVQPKTRQPQQLNASTPTLHGLLSMPWQGMLPCQGSISTHFGIDTSQIIAEVANEVIGWAAPATCREACAGVAVEARAAVASQRAASKREHQPAVVAPPVQPAAATIRPKVCPPHT